MHRYMDTMKNKQKFPHLHERVRVKDLVHESKIHFRIWNTNTLRGNYTED